MYSYRLTILAAAFLGAISAVLLSFVAEPVIFGSPPPVSSPARTGMVIPVPPPAAAQGPASSMDMDDGPLEICGPEEICDMLDDNDPIPI